LLAVFAAGHEPENQPFIRIDKNLMFFFYIEKAALGRWWQTKKNGNKITELELSP